LQLAAQLAEQSPVADAFAGAGAQPGRRIRLRFSELRFDGAQPCRQLTEVIPPQYGMAVRHTVQAGQRGLLVGGDHNTGRIVHVDQVQIALAGRVNGQTVQ